VIVIYDRFPKARHHYLVLPRQEIDGPKELTRDHLPLLQHMHDKAQSIAQRYVPIYSTSGNVIGVRFSLIKEDSSLRFRTGFHAIPSMRSLSTLAPPRRLSLIALFCRLLHLHVISQDFDSKCLKRPKHWNSFTTPFFVESEEMLAIITRDGAFNGESYKHYEEQHPLLCHKCEAKLNSINAVKSHMKKCPKWNT